ncbi:MAG: MCE family protein [Verrucomicrobia bacterium]|nr:MCE family protein [Verrucomicrobiota bacterium]
MKPPSIALRVGLFAFVALVLLAVLTISFSKGLSLGKSARELILETSNAGGMKEQAGVLLGGLKVGVVQEMSIGSDGKTVELRLKIQKDFVIRRDARFAIEQSGFLGDQHVAIYPASLTAEALADGARVRCEEPFNLQDAAKAATGFIQKVDQTARKLNELVDRIDRTVLHENTLSNLNLTLANFRLLSERTLQIADRVDTVIATNTPPLSTAVTNLMRFAENLERLGSNVNAAVAENRDELSSALQHMDDASKAIKSIAEDLESGEGIAGSLLKDAEMQAAWRSTVLNLSVLSSNLARYGILHKPRAPKPDSSKSDFGRGASNLKR